MANCSICNAKAGFTPSKIDINGKSFPLCSNCYIEYLNFNSDNIRLRKSASEYLKEHISGESEIRDHVLESVKAFESNMAEEIETAEKKKEQEQYIKENKSKLIKALLITSGFGFEHHDIEEYLDIVSGEAVIGTGFLSEFSSGISDLVGGKSTAFSEKMVEAKDVAISIMKENAVKLGANAIIGVSFSFITFSSNMIGVSVNGTAVKIS